MHTVSKKRPDMADAMPASNSPSILLPSPPALRATARRSTRGPRRRTGATCAHRDAKRSLGGPALPVCRSRLHLRRQADMAVDPKNPHVWYVAMAAGGLWKTTNSGLTFTPVFDNVRQLHDLLRARDPKDSNMVWLATGENTNLRSATRRRRLQDHRRRRDVEACGPRASEQIGRLADRSAKQRRRLRGRAGAAVRAGGDRGVYKTTDGGRRGKPS